MARAEPNERYLIKIDESVRTKDALFSRITDTAYLGYSSFSGWDAFIEMLQLRLEDDIMIEIENADLSGLLQQDRSIYLEVMTELACEYPNKLIVT